MRTTGFHVTLTLDADGVFQQIIEADVTPTLWMAISEVLLESMFRPSKSSKSADNADD